MIALTPDPFPSDVIPNPALEGLLRIGLTGREIAELAAVTAPTISKWRQGKSRTPAATMIFLTLVLAHKVEEYEGFERAYAGAGGHLSDWATNDWIGGMLGQLEAARQYLRAQEACNAAFSPESIHEGARRYRDWFNGGGDRSHAASGGRVAGFAAAPPDPADGPAAGAAV